MTLNYVSVLNNVPSVKIDVFGHKIETHPVKPMSSERAIEIAKTFQKIGRYSTLNSLWLDITTPTHARFDAARKLYDEEDERKVLAMANDIFEPGYFKTWLAVTEGESKESAVSGVFLENIIGFAALSLISKPTFTDLVRCRNSNWIRRNKPQHIRPTVSVPLQLLPSSVLDDDLVHYQVLSSFISCIPLNLRIQNDILDVPVIMQDKANTIRYHNLGAYQFARLSRETSNLTGYPVLVNTLRFASRQMLQSEIDCRLTEFVKSDSETEY